MCKECFPGRGAFCRNVDPGSWVSTWSHLYSGAGVFLRIPWVGRVVGKSDSPQQHPALKVRVLGNTQLFLTVSELCMCPVSVLLFGRQEQMTRRQRMDMSKCPACKQLLEGHWAGRLELYLTQIPLSFTRLKEGFLFYGGLVLFYF